MENFEYIEKNLSALRRDIARLEQRTGRKITLVAVTKSGTDEELLALAALGIDDLGENRPQQLRRRGDLLASHGYTPNLHEIGNLQKNKVRHIIDSVSLIHSLDSLALAEEIDRRAAAVNRTVDVLVEVNSAEEECKGGVRPCDADDLICAVKKLKHLRIMGIMTMGPATHDGEELRPYFRKTKELFDRLAKKHAFPDGGILSMGMSDSYAVAIEEGATMVRVGSLLFKKD